MTGVGDWVGNNQGIAKPDGAGPTRSVASPPIGTGY